VKRFAAIALAWLIAVSAAMYVGDWSIFRLRAHPSENVSVQHYYAIAQKTGRIDLQYDRAYTQPCARSLFPHDGMQPCWYLKRHAEQWTNI
jgi:hypothetical protein